MKKNLLVIILLIPCLNWGQNILPPDSHKKKKEKENYDLFRNVNFIPHPHEIKVDLLSYFINKKIQVSYEYQKNLRWYFGSSIAIHNNTERKNTFYFDKYYNLPKYEVIPYTRYALSNDQKKFTFIEGFVSFNGGKHKDLEGIVTDGALVYKIKEDTYFDIAIGAAVGFKTIIKKRFILDLYGGSGVNLLNEKSPKFVPRYGVNLGYCF